MQKIKRVAVLFITVFVCVASSEVRALNIQSSHPNPGQTGTFNVFGSRTEPARGFGFSATTQYEKDPLEFRNFTTGAQVRYIMDWMETTDVLAEYGFTNWATVGVDIPFSFVRYALPTNMNIRESHTSLGDITAYGKFAILHPDKYPIGFSIMPFVAAPTGSTTHFTGDHGTGWGAKLLADKEFDGGYFGVNLGYKARTRSDTVQAVGSTQSLTVDDEFVYGVGGGMDIVKKKLRVFTELIGSTAAADFAKHSQTSPMEVNGGFEIGAMKNAMKVTLGAGSGLNGGYSAPRFRVFGGLTYHWQIKPAAKRIELAKAEPAQEEVIDTIILDGIHFSYDKYTILPDSKHILDENFLKLQKYPKEHFRVIGHTDSRGSHQYNQVLSENRAKSVVDYFIKKGIAPNRLQWEGRGKREPVAPNNSESNMWLNRRAVEVQVLR
ncbi:MAG: OmpA family protein [Deltaproteobacteria bacterium]|nr:OmpA family protein [Deltaproteobacteria bacterium]